MQSSIAASNHSEADPIVDRIDWVEVMRQLDADGVAQVPALLSERECRETIELFDREDGTFRSTVVMARHAYGEGSYRYFADPLVPLVDRLRSSLYPPLARIANEWAERLDERKFPLELTRLLDQCAAAGQQRPTPLLLNYRAGGYNCLHQDLYGELAFPLQVSIMLSSVERDFTGGESMFIEQRPRQQSRGIVRRPGLGDALIFPVRHRPVPGQRGYRRVTLRHGVSTVLTGERYVLGVIFHNAK